MPTYQYRCKDCNNELEVVQKFTDDALTECPVCTGGELRKVYNAVGVVFKGSGFYRTDSRAGNSDNGGGSKGSSSSSTTSSSSSSDSGSSSGSSGSSGSGSTASTPAPATSTSS